jgi:hypothetical protein
MNVFADLQLPAGYSVASGRHLLGLTNPKPELASRTISCQFEVYIHGVGLLRGGYAYLYAPKPVSQIPYGDSEAGAAVNAVFAFSEEADRRSSPWACSVCGTPAARSVTETLAFWSRYELRANFRDDQFQLQWPVCQGSPACEQQTKELRDKQLGKMSSQLVAGTRTGNVNVSAVPVPSTVPDAPDLFLSLSLPPGYSAQQGEGPLYEINPRPELASRSITCLFRLYEKDLNTFRNARAFLYAPKPISTIPRGDKIALEAISTQNRVNFKQ